MKTTQHQDHLSRKEREKVARQREIVRSARLLFAQKGYHETTLEEIARHAEFGKGTIYNYFASKDELFLGILRDVMEDIGTIVREALDAPEANVRQKLTRYGEALLRYVRTNATTFHLLMRFFHQEEGEMPWQNKEMKQHMDEVWGALAEVVQSGIDRGEIRPIDPLEFARVFDTSLRFTALHGFMPGRAVDVDALDQTSARLVSMFFDGIVARTE